MSWTLYGQEFDLESFKKVHPGGELAIMLGKDRDCTRLFEQYHIRNNNHRLMLQHIAKEQGKDWICPEPTDPFQKDLLLAVQETHTQYALSLPAAATLAVVACLDLAAVVGWVYGSWLACVVFPFLHWLLVVNTAHDAAHFAISNHPWINRLVSFLSSPYYWVTPMWHLEHNLSHHLHTNQLNRDIDLIFGFPLFRLHPGTAWSPHMKYQVYIIAVYNFLFTSLVETIVFPILVLLQPPHFNTFFGNYSGFLQYTSVQTYTQLFINIGFLLYPFLVFAPSKAAFFSFFPPMITGAIFMAVTQISHIQEDTQASYPSESWMREMIDSSFDYAQDSPLWTFLTGGLNIQSLHHCIPVLSSSRYREFYPTYRKICEKHGIRIREAPTFWDATRLYWTYIQKLSLKNTD